MYSFLVKSTAVEAAIKGEENYDFFVYKKRKPVEINYRGKPVLVEREQSSASVNLLTVRTFAWCSRVHPLRYTR